MRGFKEMHDEDRLSQRASQLSIKTVEEPQEAFSVDDTNVDELIITAELSVSNLDSKNDESWLGSGESESEDDDGEDDLVALAAMEGDMGVLDSDEGAAAK